MRALPPSLLCLVVVATCGASCIPRPVPCSAESCSGCCDAQGTCRSGGEAQACGLGGSVCQACSLTQSCFEGGCIPLGGGGGSGGGAGGRMAGGAGGGMAGETVAEPAAAEWAVAWLAERAGARRRAGVG